MAWWWFQSIFHRNVIQRNLLGHSFCCFFMGMLDVYKCRTKTWSIVFFTVLKINDLYILPPLFGESFEVKHIPCRKKMQNTTFILALSNFHNNWICLHYSPYCVPLKTTMAFWFDKFFFWENPPCLNYMLLHNFLSSF